jgi:hypothetical protein
MALYKADVWLGSSSGRQTVSVSASSINGAREQIRTIYQVSDPAICNLHEAARERAGDGAGDDGDPSLWGGAALVVLLALAWVVTSFTPQVFGAAGGSAAWWLLCRLQGKRFDDLLLPSNRRALVITAALSTAVGVASSLLGRQVQLDHFSGAPPAAREVRSTGRETQPQDPPGPRPKAAAGPGSGTFEGDRRDAPHSAGRQR